MNYTEKVSEFDLDCLETVDSFNQAVEDGCYGWDDGHGYPVKDMFYDPSFVINAGDEIPSDATHILWFNK